TLPCVLQVAMRDLREAARRVKAGRELVGDRLVLDEPVLACRPYGSLVEALGIQHTAFDASDFRTDQKRAVLEVLRTILRPDIELSLVQGQSVQVLLALGA